MAIIAKQRASHSYSAFNHPEKEEELFFLLEFMVTIQAHTWDDMLEPHQDYMQLTEQLITFKLCLPWPNFAYLPDTATNS